MKKKVCPSIKYICSKSGVCKKKGVKLMRKKKKEPSPLLQLLLPWSCFSRHLSTSLMPVAEAGSGSGTAGGIGLDLVLNPLKPLLGINLSKSGVSVNLNLLDYLELKLGLSCRKSWS